MRERSVLLSLALVLAANVARVAEAGSHEELLARDDRYAGRYRIQAAGYS